MSSDDSMNIGTVYIYALNVCVCLVACFQSVQMEWLDYIAFTMTTSKLAVVGRRGATNTNGNMISVLGWKPQGRANIWNNVLRC